MSRQGPFHLGVARETHRPQLGDGQPLVVELGGANKASDLTASSPVIARRSLDEDSRAVDAQTVLVPCHKLRGYIRGCMGATDTVEQDEAGEEAKEAHRGGNHRRLGAWTTLSSTRPNGPAAGHESVNNVRH